MAKRKFTEEELVQFIEEFDVTLDNNCKEEFYGTEKKNLKHLKLS